MNEVASKVIHVIGSTLGLEDGEVGEEMYLRDDLNIDQLALSDIVISLEEEFKINIPQEDIEHFKTVGDVKTCVLEQLNEL
jgi:acyl carrier protein